MISIDTPDFSVPVFFGVSKYIAPLERAFLDGIHFRHAIGVCCDEHRLGSEEPYPKDLVQGSVRVKTIFWQTLVF